MRSVASVVVALVMLNSALLVGQAVTPRADLATLTPNAGGVSLRFQNAQFREAMEALETATGIEIMVPRDVRLPTGAFTVMFREAGFAGAFTNLLTAGNLDYVVIDEKTVVLKNKSQ